MVILFVLFQVLCELVDPRCEERHLNFSRSGIAFVRSVLVNNGSLVFFL